MWLDEGGGEVQLHARMLLQKVSNELGFVGGEVGEDDMNLLPRGAQRYHFCEEDNEVTAGMAGCGSSVHAAGPSGQWQAVTKATLRGKEKKLELVVADLPIGEFVIDESFTLELLELVHPQEIRSRLQNGGWRRVSVRMVIALLRSGVISMAEEIPPM
jgi:hypothetical protein